MDISNIPVHTFSKIFLRNVDLNLFGKINFSVDIL